MILSLVQKRYSGARIGVVDGRRKNIDEDASKLGSWKFSWVECGTAPGMCRDSGPAGTFAMCASPGVEPW